MVNDERPRPFDPRTGLAWVVARRSTLLLVALGLLAPLWLVSGLAADVMAQQPFEIDRSWPLFLKAHARPWLDSWMIAASVAGSYKGVDSVALLLVAALAFKRRWTDAGFVVLGIGGAQLLSHAIKSAFQRARPDLWVSQVPETSYSFPSGHAMQTLALALVLTVLAWPTRWRGRVLLISGAFAVTVGLSRVYLGVHFPTDVMAGWCITTVWVTCLHLVLRQAPLRPT